MLVTLRSVDAPKVLVLDKAVAATIELGMNLRDRLTVTQKQRGGLWDLRSFRIELDDAEV